jgi:hypothetical protein
LALRIPPPPPKKKKKKKKTAHENPGNSTFKGQRLRKEKR